MLKLGYVQVGQSFPVFLHPQTKEEYALARIERKVAPGYSGFEFDCSKQVTLEQDLLRRDLTINAMAETEQGQLIDPYHGQEDLNNRVLRHVSSAFAEDPVRILRVARFAARYHALGFTIAPETMALMIKMVKAGEVDALVPERVTQEMLKALGEEKPSIFFRTLEQCGAEKILFADVISCSEELLKAIDNSVALSKELEVCFAVTMSYGPTVAAVEKLCSKLRVSKHYKQLAMLVNCHRHTVHRAQDLSAKELVNLLEEMDSFRRPERFQQALLACAADSQEPGQYLPAELLWQAQQQAAAVSAKQLIEEGFTGTALAAELHQRRIAALS